MFTDDKMEQVYAQAGGFIGVTEALKVLMETLPDYPDVNSLKHAHYTWKAFARRHEEVSPNGFANILCKLNPDKEQLIRSVLK